MLFSYKFFTFSRLFSQHPNKFYYKKFQNHSQIPTPHATETPIQPTVANSGNQKPQPPKHHYHTTITTTKIKITERDRWVKRRKIEGEINRRTGACDLGFLLIVRLERAISGLEHVIWASSGSSDWSVRSSDWSMQSRLPLDRRTGACSCWTGDLVRAIVGLELGVRRRR